MLSAPTIARVPGRSFPLRSCDMEREQAHAAVDRALAVVTALRRGDRDAAGALAAADPDPALTLLALAGMAEVLSAPLPDPVWAGKCREAATWHWE